MVTPVILSRSEALVVNQGCELLQIVLPDGQSRVVWRGWPSELTVPPRSPGKYHPVMVFGRPILQPRRTKCYGHAYKYSGQTHPREDIIPTEIEALLNYTNFLYGLTAGDQVNMCLENHYETGRHYISEHSDDEKQMGRLHQVFCWVAGPAQRVLVVRTRGSARPKSREVLRVKLPAGLYVMDGPHFQQRYTHQFPQLHPSLFQRLVKKYRVRPDFPSDSLIQADWLKAHRSEVWANLGVSDREKYDEWCLSRTSYTLRNFV